MNNSELLSKIKQQGQLDSEIKDVLYGELYKMYDSKELNKGNLPEKKSAKQSVTIRGYSSDRDKIIIDIEIWWGGDCSDYDSVTIKTNSELS